MSPRRARRPAAARARGEPRARRHRRVALRRPRRRDQHHAPPAPGAGRRGDPPRPRPLGRGDRRGRGPGGRARRRGVVLPGRPHGVLPLPGRAAARARRGRTCACTAAAAARSRPRRRARSQAHGVARIFSPEDGRALGLEGMIRSLLDECRGAPRARRRRRARRALAGEPGSRSRARSRWLEAARRGRRRGRGAARGARGARARAPRRPWSASPAPAAPASRASSTSSCCALRRDAPGRARSALLLVDPTRRRTGGALLGDRIRMNAIHGPRVFVRSLATRRAHLALSRTVGDALRVLQAAGFDLSSSRPRASGRATPRSSISSTSRST